MPGQFLYGRRGGRGLDAKQLDVLKDLPLLYVTGSDDVRRGTVRTIVFTLKTLGLDCALREVPKVGHVFPPQREYARVLAFFGGKQGAGDAYELLKGFTRGRSITQEDLRAFVAGLELPSDDKKRLIVLTPASYTGIAAELVARMEG